MTRILPVVQHLHGIDCSVNEPGVRRASDNNVWNAFSVLRLVVRISNYSPGCNCDARRRWTFVTGTASV